VRGIHHGGLRSLQPYPSRTKRRSIGAAHRPVLPVYVLVYAGAVLGEGALSVRAPLDVIMRHAWLDAIGALPWATIGTVL